MNRSMWCWSDWLCRIDECTRQEAVFTRLYTRAPLRLCGSTFMELWYVDVGSEIDLHSDKVARDRVRGILFVRKTD